MMTVKPWLCARRRGRPALFDETREAHLDMAPRHETTLRRSKIGERRRSGDPDLDLQ